MKLSMKNKTEQESRSAIRRALNQRITFQIGYELTLLLFLTTVGVSIHSASTDVAEKGTSKKSETQFIIAISGSTIEVDNGKVNQYVPTLSDAISAIKKECAKTSAAQFKIVLAPSAEKFLNVPAWYRIVRSNFPQNVNVSVAIP
jgi:hypothetical protein